MYKWTVNWKLLDEDLFLNRKFHAALLAGHLALLAVFLRQTLVPYGGLRELLRWRVAPARDAAKGVPASASSRKQPAAVLPRSDPTLLVQLLFLSNLAGMVFSRSLHYQFYVWYYHTLPWLLWRTTLPIVMR